ncbi:tRNA dimethylallyltransferase [Lachnospiraceae bacterium PF1-21]|uniref:tRNA dimethylallyltransferase n=1 Tax=Ohessyouella blattaphilus TaxID=2949333 RepID=A0ABT1EET9_9FIRM|nr:tRNA (adenosine(37)-N6)-dimethylallyltransferase MiaA [Ohessyouella blattaphilus]MCP1109203.1 tRNA (adenosine(37)-N6)-dimethylallyltransferase MiaA [Ohessyouella blattaphilus]MCR8562597.1 tRNA (adenosine(37)-N6)-dimethylallyltransferase MiaA [Ohessyouella blattaphilus]
MRKKPLVVLSGPTAVGKTELSIALAKAIGGSIISADSMQVYRQMDIGSAKISAAQMGGVPHYLVDVLDPSEDFNVARFKEMATEALAEIYAQGKVPIIVGGTGFYIQALLYDIDFTPEGEEASKGEVRKELENLAIKEGNDSLHRRLQEVDPESAATIHPNNVKKVIRALEYWELNHEKISVHNDRERQKESPYNYRYFVLNLPREVLYERIDQRVEQMLSSGLVEEVKGLRDKGYHKGQVSMQGLGYKEILAYLDGEIPLSQAVYLIKRDTRHFAKRQLTWFRREKEVIMVEKDGQEFATILEKTKEILA